ncbi:hypothetical protein [Paenibacillus sp. GCM10027626]|uniref:hypothetical protein n=1 Tax=Paenibacillus sp. GCM10027626 TaxID=3273411 RepID=UPI0036395119
MFNRLSAFLGKPLPFHGVSVHSPTIDEIADKGYAHYQIHLILATFDKEGVLLHLFGISEQDYAPLAEQDSFDLLTSHSQIAQHIADSLSFFVKADVSYLPEENSFACDGTLFLDKTNYQEWITLIQQLNGMTDSSKKTELQFKNERAKRLYNEMQRQKRKLSANQQDALELKDILSILCSVEGNAVSVFNVGSLTIYQVYEQFERLSLNYKRQTLLPVWANGYLGEGEKLPELFTKTTL